MLYYIDIQVLPDLETSAPVLMNNLFAKLHRQLAAVGNGAVGISFPNAHKTLGDTLRLHGTQAALETMMANTWLKGLRDYTRVTAIIAIPSEIKGYQTVKRVQAKTANNKRKRSIAKGWISADEAIHAIPNTAERRLTLPYVQIQSLSNQNVMRVFIEHSQVVSAATDGVFSSYGLSATATIPVF